MPAIIIGGTGLLGSALALRLKSEGRFVVATGSNPRRKKLLKDQGIVFLPYDFFTTSGEELVREARKELYQGRITVYFCARVCSDPRTDLIEAQMKSLMRAIANTEEWHFVLCTSADVFSGEGRETKETIGPNPRTAAGVCHYKMERIVRSLIPARSLIIRMSQLFGRDELTGELDQHLAGVIRQIQSGRTVQLFTDMFRSPLSVQQAAQVISAQALIPDIRYLHVAGYRMSVYEFIYRALATLGADTTRLEALTLPPPGQRPSGQIPDTSLSFERMTKLTGIVPQTIEQALA
jgi:dTDP-4-dehydrorhamnose reductase